MVVSGFEYRHRFAFIVLVYVAAYSFYNLDHLNVLYALIPWNQGVAQRDLLARLFYAVATIIAIIGTMLLTWATAYRPPPRSNSDRLEFSTGGPFRYVRNPHYLAYFLLIIALGTFQSRLGFLIMLISETILLLRLIAREEFLLTNAYGQRFAAYTQRVPHLLPSLSPQVADDNDQPQWLRALWLQAPQWGFVATLAAFAVTLSDPIGYAFAYATLAFLLLQKLTSQIVIRFRRA
jgi:protein-S-isoprenylcysteine O-methyltransferase Ste14